jgi:hypothetical protein
MSRIYKNTLEAPILDLEPNMCAKYARIASQIMSGELFYPANAWDLHKKNPVLRNTDNYIIKHSSDILIPKKTIVTFFDPRSNYNTKGRNCTHAMLYIGKQRGDLFFAEQRGKKQQIISLSDIIAQELDSKEILKAALGNLRN